MVHIKGRKSHAIVSDALQILRNLDHRGACGCEPNTGDGAGILMQMPHGFLQLAAKQAGVVLPGEKEYGLGMVYLPLDPAERRECEVVLEQIIVG